MSEAIFLLVMVGLYFLPTVIAFARHKKNVGALVVINFFFGWTVVGWIITLAWALMAESPAVASQS